MPRLYFAEDGALGRPTEGSRTGPGPIAVKGRVIIAKATRPSAKVTEGKVSTLGVRRTQRFTAVLRRSHSSRRRYVSATRKPSCPNAHPLTPCSREMPAAGGRELIGQFIGSTSARGLETAIVEGEPIILAALPVVTLLERGGSDVLHEVVRDALRRIGAGSYDARDLPVRVTH